MASPTSFDTLTRREILKGISDNVIQDNELLAAIMDAGGVEYNCGGNGGEFDVRVKKANIGGAVTDEHMGTAARINPYRTAVYRYRPYLWRLYENALQADRHKYAPDAFKSADMVENDLNTINQEAVEQIGNHAYLDGATLLTGDDPAATPIEGADNLTDDGGTYGTFFGLSRTTFTALRGQVIDCSNPSLTDNPDLGNNFLVSIEDLYLACSGGIGPDNGSVSKSLAKGKSELDLIIMTSTLMRIFRLSLNQQNQYVDDKQNPRKKLAYGNAMVTYDTFCKANRAFGFKVKHWKMRVCGPQLIREIKRVDTVNPVGTTYVIGTSGAQLLNKLPRYSGKIETTGT